MDFVCVENFPSGTVEIRKQKSLSLASDVALLKCMEDLSQIIDTQTRKLIDELDAVKRDAVAVCLGVENCAHNLDLISSKQFTEKRIYDEDVKDRHDNVNSVVQGGKEVGDFVPKVKEALSFSLQVLKSRLDKRKNTLSVNSETKQNVFRPPNFQSRYSSRPLPLLIGSKEFLNDPTVGIALPCLNVEITTIEHLATNKLLEDALNETSPLPHSPSSVSSEESTIDDQLIEKEDDNVIDSIQPTQPLDFQSELAARLRLSLPDEKFSEQQHFLPKNQHNLVIDSSSEEEVVMEKETVPATGSRSFVGFGQSSGSASPTATEKREKDISAQTVVAKPVYESTRNLFDDSSESDDDLFKVGAPKVNAPQFFPSVASKTVGAKNTSTVTESITSKHSSNLLKPASTIRKNSLFDSSDSDDDDLFRPVPKPVQVTKDSSLGDGIFSSSVQKASEKPGFDVVKDSVMKGSLPPTLPKPGIHHSIESFDGNRIQAFGHLASQSRLNNAADQSSVCGSVNISKENVPTSSIAPRGTSLFGDSDSDDDLLNNLNRSKISSSMPASQLLGDKDGSRVHKVEVSEEVVNTAGNNLVGDSNKKVLLSSTSGGNRGTSLVKSNAAYEENNRTVTDPSKLAPKASNLFGDDSEDDDLFTGNLTRTGSKSVKVLGKELVVPIPSDTPNHCPKPDDDSIKSDTITEPVAESENRQNKNTLTDRSQLQTAPASLNGVVDRLEGETSNLISTLKRELASQSSLVTAPTSVIGSPPSEISSIGRKPFSGVPILGTMHSPLPNYSNDRKASPEDVTGYCETNQSLFCPGKNRPKVSSGRRLPSRNHRRSMIVEKDVNDAVRSENVAVPSLDVIDGFEGDKYGQGGIKATVSPSGEEFPVSDGSPNLLINKECYGRRPNLEENKLEPGNHSIAQAMSGLINTSLMNDGRENSSDNNVAKKGESRNSHDTKDLKVAKEKSVFADDSDSDDGLFSNNFARHPAKSSAYEPKSVVSSSDDDLFTGSIKSKPVTCNEAGPLCIQRTDNNISDPLSGFHE